MRRRKILLRILLASLSLVMIVCFPVSCVSSQFEPISEQDKQVAEDMVREYYREISGWMNGYLTEASQEKLEECEPELVGIFTPGYRSLSDYSFGMSEGYNLVLHNRYRLSLDLGVIANGRIASHMGNYDSPSFPCASLDDAIQQIVDHEPPMMEGEEWIQPVFSCFYPEGTDVRAEWMAMYEEMVADVSENGLPMGEVWNKYQITKTIMTTEDGRYDLVFSVYYYDHSESWDYSYHIDLYPEDRS